MSDVVSMLKKRINKLSKNRKYSCRSFNPVTSDQIAAAESQLGFALPPPLRQFYSEVGNGGLGIFGLPGGETDYEGRDLISLYWYYRSSVDPDVPEWPEGLLPFTEWGCGITSSVYCAQEPFPVIRHDINENIEKLRIKADFQEMQAQLDDFGFSDSYDKILNASWVEAKSLDAWLYAAARGKHLFFLGYPMSMRPTQYEYREEPFVK